MTTKNNITNINSELSLLIKGSENDLKTNVTNEELEVIISNIFSIEKNFFKLTALFLAKIYDEKVITIYGKAYSFQVFPDDLSKNNSHHSYITRRINFLYQGAVQYFLSYDKRIKRIKNINIAHRNTIKLVKILQPFCFSTNNYNIFKLFLKKILLYHYSIS